MRSTGMSPVVEAWSTCRTSSAHDWPPGRLLQAKGQTTVSVVMPARDEEATTPAPSDETRLLTEIRDLLAARR